jgi:tetratricopeptide (TPR) repeat protein
VGGDPKVAQRYADAIVPHDAWVGAFMQLAVHEAARDSAAMERVLLGTLRAFPDSVAPRLGLAMLYQDGGRPLESWPLLQPLVERDRPHNGALYLVGRLSAVSGAELERGERALRRYLQSMPQPGEPSHAAARTRIGDILHHRGDPAGARREYEAALRLDPDFQQAKDALRRLR